MSTKYSDIITIAKTRTVYNILIEEPDAWKTFIANTQFNDLLNKTIKSVFNDDPDYHKSIWIAGTYGSGKSHAGAVLKHLLCDPVSEITDYIEQEFSLPQFEILKTKLLTLRELKRLFPVGLYGQQSITHEEDLSLQVQRVVKCALEQAGLNINVKTDFDTYVDHINQHNDFWSSLIEKSPQLRSVTPDVKKLKRSLAECDAGVLDRVNSALRENRFDVRMDSNNLLTWLTEIETKLRECSGYDGLLIMWDEFTEICTSSIGIKLLERIQEIADAFMSSAHDSYFVLISHPSALNGLNEQKRSQTIGRYIYVTYNMEPVSAFKIMSRKFCIIDRTAHNNLVTNFYKDRPLLLEKYSASSNQPAETKEDIKKLYPLHPGTADLATYYAREAGSSSRSVFEFLASDAVRDFFDRQSVFANKETLTADYLWDYVREAFTEVPAKFGAVTEKFNSYQANVSKKGSAYAKVFKGILLLNALNNIANSSTVTPSSENIKALFAGTDFENDVEHILDFFNEQSIIQRLPGDLFSIQFTALPSNEIETLKKELYSTQFRFTEQIANFSDIIPEEFQRVNSQIARPYKAVVYSLHANEHTLISKIENGRKSCLGHELFVAVLVAKDSTELNELKNYAQRWNVEQRMKNCIIIIFDATLDAKKYDDFINLMANAACAEKHALNAQAETHRTNAKKMVKEWAGKMRAGNATYYLNGKQGPLAGTQVFQTINSILAPSIFNKGPEALELIRTGSAQTYWKKQTAKVALDAVLLHDSKEEIIKKAGGQGKHIDFLLQDSVDNNLEWKDNIDPAHPLKQVCDFVDDIFKKINRNQEFNLGEKLKPLSEPPFGLYRGYAGMAMVAFAMRKYAKQIFSLNGKPRERRHLVDDIRDMFIAWDKSQKDSKLRFILENKESTELCRYLIRVFDLHKLPTYKDISSLTDARWAMLEYAKKKKYPLWSLKYTEAKSEISDLIDKIIKICDPKGLEQHQMIHEAVKLFANTELDLASILTDSKIFEKGFQNYANIKNNQILNESDFASLYEYLCKNLQGEIGQWGEQEVEMLLLRWKLESTSNPSGSSSLPTSPVIAPDNNRVPESIGVVSETETLARIKNRLLEEIQSLSEEKLRACLTSLIENANSSIIDIIAKYVH